MADERRGLLLRGWIRLELDSVLGHEVVEVVLSASGIDEVRRDHRVLRGRLTEPQRLRVVREDFDVRPL